MWFIRRCQAAGLPSVPKCYSNDAVQDDLSVLSGRAYIQRSFVAQTESAYMPQVGERVQFFAAGYRDFLAACDDISWRVDKLPTIFATDDVLSGRACLVQQIEYTFGEIAFRGPRKKGTTQHVYCKICLSTLPATGAASADDNCEFTVWYREVQDVPPFMVEVSLTVPSHMCFLVPSLTQAQHHSVALLPAGTLLSERERLGKQCNGRDRNRHRWRALRRSAFHNGNIGWSGAASVRCRVRWK